MSKYNRRNYNSDYRRIYDQLCRKLRNHSMFDIYSDYDPGDRIGMELEEREELYTELLSDYSKITKIRNILKEIHKWIFFWLIIVAGIIMVVYICNIMNRVLELKEEPQFLEAVPVIITALVAFITAIIGIPTTIAKFLFNEKEDANITETVHHTQDHDFEEVQLFKERYIPNKNLKDDEIDGDTAK